MFISTHPEKDIDCFSLTAPYHTTLKVGPTTPARLAGQHITRVYPSLFSSARIVDTAAINGFLCRYWEF